MKLDAPSRPRGPTARARVTRGERRPGDAAVRPFKRSGRTTTTSRNTGSERIHPSSSMEDCCRQADITSPSNDPPPRRGTPIGASCDRLDPAVSHGRQWRVCPRHVQPSSLSAGRHRRVKKHPIGSCRRSEAVATPWCQPRFCSATLSSIVCICVAKEKCWSSRRSTNP